MFIRKTEFLKAIKSPRRDFTKALGPHEARLLIRRILLNGAAPNALDTDLIGVEIAGRIAQLGLDAPASVPWSGFSVGDKVAVRSVTGCGQCDRCLAAMPMACDLATDALVEVEAVKDDQQLKLYMCVAATDAHLERFSGIPDGEAAALIPSTVAEAYAAAHRNYPGGGAAIIGAGASGLTILQILRTMGVPNIGVVDHDAARLAAAHRLGAVPIDASTADVPAALARLRDDGIFTVFVTNDTDSSSIQRSVSLRHAAKACEPGGVLVFTGAGFDFRDVPWNLAGHKALTLVPAPAVDREATDVAAQHVKFHGIDVSGFVTHRLDFEDGAQAIELIEGGAEGLIKLALRPRATTSISLADAARW